MSGPPLTVRELVEEFLAETGKLVSYGEQAQKALAERDAQSAAITLDAAHRLALQIEDAVDNVIDSSC